jgi:DNA-binding Lrp family transcriptional regulator
MEELRTGVDELLALLAGGARISLPDAAKQLKQSEATVQNWVDFLVEEKIVGIEYKFTTPYIYRNSPQKRATQKQESIAQLREQFLAHAAEKNIPADKLAELWEHHLLAAIEAKQPFFTSEAQKRKLVGVPELWKRYTERVIGEHGLRHVA